jgi:hypothetical protein
MFASLAHSYNFYNIAVLVSFAAKSQAVGSILSLVNNNLLINTPVVSFSLVHSHNYSYISVLLPVVASCQAVNLLSCASNSSRKMSVCSPACTLSNKNTII